MGPEATLESLLAVIEVPPYLATPRPQNLLIWWYLGVSRQQRSCRPREGNGHPQSRILLGRGLEQRGPSFETAASRVLPAKLLQMVWSRVFLTTANPRDLTRQASR